MGHLAWLSQKSVLTLDLSVMSSSLTLGVKSTKIKN